MNIRFPVAARENNLGVPSVLIDAGGRVFAEVLPAEASSPDWYEVTENTWFIVDALNATEQAQREASGLTEEEMASDRRVAYHEAGHAVACYLLHKPFHYVTIQGEDLEGTLGHVMPWDAPASIRPDITMTARIRDWIERDVMVSFAGQVADEMAGYSPLDPNYYGQRGDNASVIDRASYVAQGDEQLEHYLAWLLARTKDMLALPWHWAAVEAVADALQERRRLSGREARRITREAIHAFFEKNEDEEEEETP